MDLQYNVLEMTCSFTNKKNILGKNITLQIQVHRIRGTLAINIPPPPTNRIWYGFRNPPIIEIAILPRFGDHYYSKAEGSFASILKLLERRAKQEFMKVCVMPNMDDIPIPLLPRLPTRN